MYRLVKGEWLKKTTRTSGGASAYERLDFDDGPRILLSACQLARIDLCNICAVLWKLL